MKIDEIIQIKENKQKISYQQIAYMVNKYVDKKISDKDMSRFLMAIYNFGLSEEEIYYLTDVMIKSGKIIDLSKIKIPLVDKHSTGGIGDKTTLIVGPIVASLGLGVAKMSGRSLGFTGGTIDKLESIEGYNTNLSEEEFIENINKVGICLISQSEDVAVADKKIYSLRDEIGAVDSLALIASSIMSKKIASGVDKIVIDMKVGRGAFMKNIKDAKQLSNLMIKIGKRYNKEVVCVLTDMDYPLGRCVGNAIEVKESIDFFNGEYEPRFKKLVIEISSVMVSIAKGLNLNKSRKQVLSSLKNGKAKAKFYEWISSQGGEVQNLKDKSSSIDVLSTKEGYINDINPLKISKLVFDLGAGRKSKEDAIDLSVGVKINKTLGTYVKKGEALGTIFYNKKQENVNNIFRDCFVIEQKNKKIKDIIIKTIK